MDRNRNTPAAFAVLLCGFTLAACTQPAAHRDPKTTSATRGGEVAAPDGAAVSQPPTCPASDFRGFLEAFAADPAIRSRYTAETVAVTQWKDIDETDLGTKVVSIPRASYTGFTLVFRDGAFHHVAADGTVDPATEAPTVKASDSGFDVRYVYGMSEGNSWHFSPREGCWVLTSDPEPPSP